MNEQFPQLVLFDLLLHSIFTSHVTELFLVVDAEPSLPKKQRTQHQQDRARWGVVLDG